MINANECHYTEKLASGEVLLQKIEAYVFDYTRPTLKETVKKFHDLMCLRAFDLKAIEDHKRTVGYIAGTTTKNNEIVIRGSFCIPNDFHVFDSAFGKDWAIAKLYTDQCNNKFWEEHKSNFVDNYILGEGIFYNMPYTLEEVYKYFTDRCTSYFVGATIHPNSVLPVPEKEDDTPDLLANTDNK